MNFTYQEYVAMLNALKEQGYKIADYCNYKEYEKCVILRHDVDYSLEKALELAKLEKKEKVFSTYMIMVSSGFYNPMQRETKNILKEILACGHRLGLHFDEANYPIKSMEHLRQNICREMKLLRECSGDESITVISMHRPSKECLEANLDFSKEGLINSYGKVFFQEFKYVSDSRMTWREPIMEYIKHGEYNRLHILTHAFWYSKKEQTIEHKLEKFLSEAEKHRCQLLDENFRDLHEFIERD